MAARSKCTTPVIGIHKLKTPGVTRIEPVETTGILTEVAMGPICDELQIATLISKSRAFRMAKCVPYAKS